MLESSGSRINLKMYIKPEKKMEAAKTEQDILFNILLTDLNSYFFSPLFRFLHFPHPFFSLDQSRNHLATIEQVKADLKATRASATADLTRVQEDLAGTSQDLEATQAELAEMKRSSAELKITVVSLNDDLARYRNLQEESTNDVSYRPKNPMICGLHFSKVFL